MELSELPGTCDYFLPRIREVFDCNLFKYFLRSFLFFFFFGDPYNANAGAFNVVPAVSETVLISFLCLFFILFYGNDFHHSEFQLIHSAAVILLLILSHVFFIPIIVLFACFFVL